MVSALLIKICGIQEPQMAFEAASAGANFIGLIFASQSKRTVDLQIATAIAHRARAGGAEPVAVFTDTNAVDMTKICLQNNIRWVQLHGKLAREQHHLLPSTLHRIYVCSVFSDGTLNTADLIHMKSLQTHRDYLLFDNYLPGSGQAFSWSNFHYAGEFRWFLSGGLRESNIEQACQFLQPFGLDVSSGVENSAGKKELKLIENFITQARRIL